MKPLTLNLESRDINPIYIRGGVINIREINLKVHQIPRIQYALVSKSERESEMT